MTIQSYLALKNKHIQRLKSEISYLSNIDGNYSVEILVKGVLMNIDHEVLLKEKQSELDNVNIYFDRLNELTEEIIENGNSIGTLRRENGCEVELYLKGVKFLFNKDKLLKDLEEKQQRLINEQKEIKQYFETGKQIL